MLVLGFMALLTVVLLVLGVPMAFAIGLAPVAIALQTGATPVQVFTVQMFSTASNFLLLAIPLFVFASKVMEAGGLAADLVRLAELIVGRLRGGLGVAVVLSSMLFSGMTGAKVAEVAAISQTTVPALRHRGQDPSYAAAIVVAASAAGELVPPAINMIIVAETLSVSVTGLFAGSILAAVLLGVLTCALVIVRGDRPGRTIEAGDASVSADADVSLSQSSTWAAVRGGVVAGFLPLIVFGGILKGIFSPTEAAGVASLYAIVVVGIVYRRLSWRRLLGIAADSAVLSGALMLLIMAAAVFSQMLSVEQLQFTITQVIGHMGNSSSVVVLITILLFVTTGSVLEGLPAVIIFAPVLAPLAAAAGINPTQFGVLLVACIGLGLCLPPVGICFVTACAVSDTLAAKVTRRYWPFAVVLLVGVLLIGFFPPFSTFLPRFVQ